MYENPWQFEIGDLVKCRTLEPTLPLIVSAAHLRPGTGVIVDRRRRCFHVEARPVRMVEVDEYCVMVEGVGQWAPIEALTLTQSKEARQ